MANLKENIERMKTETFGVEIETYGLGQQKSAYVVAKALNDWYETNTCTVVYDGSHLDNYVVKDPTGRKWQFVRDGSIHGGSGCEFVTPILHYDDIELLQTLVRALRNAGARSDDRIGGCGVHIHVGIKNDQYPATPKSIRNLANIVKNHERLIIKSIKMSQHRWNGGYAKVISPRLIEQLNTKKPDTWDKLKRLHYGTLGGGTSHYSESRYYFLNLHAIWDKGTVEFRCFEFQGQLHAGWLKTWIQLCMALVSYSKIVSYARPHEVYDSNEKYCMKTWLTNLGLIGDEFKTCRTLMLRRLDGDASQKTPRQAVDTLDDLGMDIDQ